MRILYILIVFSALFLALLDPAQAARGPGMDSIYGEELLNVPPLIKSKFENDTGKPWSETTFEEREEFLNEWQGRRAAALDEDKNRAKEIQQEKKQQWQKDRTKARLKRDRARALMLKEKAKMNEKRADERKKRELNKKRMDAMRKLKKNQTARQRK
jgi:hypothetical protein